MAALTAFLKQVQLEVPNCSQPILLEAILRACIEFCERTELFDETTDVTTVAGTATYTPSFASGMVATRAVYVKRDDELLTRTNRDVFNAYDDLVEAGEADSYYLSSTGKLVLGPVPDAVETLEFKAIVKPAATATTVPDALSDDWATAIGNGAKTKLFAQRNTPWYAPDEAIMQASMFSAHVTKAINSRNTGRSGALLRVKMRPFA